MIRVRSYVLPLTCLALACSPGVLHADIFAFTLGSATPSFTDGQNVGETTYNAAVAGNAAPFNGVIGSDISGPNFSATWAYNYAAIGGTIASATLMLGMWDTDAQGAGNQVANFTVGGVNLTATLNTAFEGHGGATGEYDIYTITLPGSTFAALAAGTPGLALSLQNGLGTLGSTPFNGAGLDFSTLSITTNTTSGTVPEPAAGVLLLTVIAAVACVRTRGQRVV